MTPTRAGRWLFGPGSDLLFGCGLLYGLVFLTLGVGGDAAWTGKLNGLAPLLLPFVSLPHYGATLLRVYERREDRHRYTRFGLYVTALVFGLFVAGIYDAWIGSLLLTVYITWSPWHYSGQNYGLALMFLRRRGADVTPAVKRLLYASFVLSYGFAVLGMHTAKGTGGVAYNAIDYSGSSISFLPLGIPAAPADVLLLGVAAAYLACLAACARLLLRSAEPRDLIPVAALVVTQALWFSVPFSLSRLGIHTGIVPIDRHFDLVDFIFWVALGHAAQYLWITAYYARASAGWGGFGRYFAKTLLAGVAVWTLPVFAFGPDLLGPRSNWVAVGQVTAAVVNIHHFILDGAIWKLRDGRIASILLRPARVAPAQPRLGVSWLRPLVWTLLCGWAVFHVAGLAQRKLAARDLEPLQIERLRTAAQRLRWLGKDLPEIHTALGIDAGGRGDLELARRELVRSLQLQASARAWAGLAFIEVESGRSEAARAAIANALRLEPANADVWAAAAEVYQALGDTSAAQRALERRQALREMRALP